MSGGTLRLVILLRIAAFVLGLATLFVAWPGSLEQVKPAVERAQSVGAKVTERIENYRGVTKAFGLLSTLLVVGSWVFFAKAYFNLFYFKERGADDFFSYFVLVFIVTPLFYIFRDLTYWGLDISAVQSLMDATKRSLSAEADVFKKIGSVLDCLVAVNLYLMGKRGLSRN